MGYPDLLDFSYLAGKVKKKPTQGEWYLEYFIPFGSFIHTAGTIEREIS